MIEDYTEFVRQRKIEQRKKLIALASFVSVIVGATLLGFAYGWQTGWGVGFIAWAIIPVAEA